ncbi:MAG: PAS domain S-box protein [Deltaproteobacteria bacterium]|nr:PAS domain S-box protein [Kofleriaceae bacterium]
MRSSALSGNVRAVRIGRAIAWGLAGLSSLVLAGWAFDIEVLKAPVLGTRVMVPNTAVMFGLLALALGLLAAPDTPSGQRRAGRAVATVTAGVAATFFAEHTFALGLGVEHWIADVEPALPAPETSIVFALLGIALVVLDLRQRRGPPLAEVLALAGFALALLVAIGHFYGYVFFEKLPIGMAVHTSVGLLALSIGVIAVRPDRGVSALAVSAHSGGALVRRLLVVAAIAVPAAGLLGVSLQAAGAFPAPGEAVLGSTLALVVILAAILISGARIGRVEAELRHWTDFINAAPFGAGFGSPDGRLLRVNEAFARMHGWARDELVGRPLAELFGPESRPRLAEHLATIDRLGRHRFEAEHVRRDGTVFPVVVDAAAVRDERGALLYRVAYVQDITDERRAREDQARLASLVESADDAIVATDLVGTVLTWNRGAERLYGYTAEEMIGQSSGRLAPAERMPERESLLARLQRGEMLTGFESERARKDGSVVPVSMTVSPIRGPGGISGLVGIARDISGRLAAERALAEAHDDLTRIERAALAVGDAIAELPSISLCRVLEVIAAEARGLTGACCAAVALATPPEDTPRSCVASGEPGKRLGAVLGVPVRFRDEIRGHIFVARRSGESAFDARDRRVLEHLATHLGAALEIALLYQREAIERARLDATIAQIPEGVIVLDAEGNVVHENPVARTYRDVEGAPQPYDVRRPTDEPMPLEELPLYRAFARGETSAGVEIGVKVPSGELVPLLASASPIFVGHTQVGAIAVFRDIRARKELERLREEWTSVIAHDLRQPINAIRLAADVVARTASEARVSTWAHRIVSEVLRLDTMISDLLDASKLEARRLMLRRRPVRPAALIEDALARVPELATRGEVRVESGLPPVLVDETRALQVLGNLLTNAVKYGDETAPIVLTASRDGDAVRFSVANRGPGIPADELPAIFDRFMRTKAARRGSVDGTGLGLYICKGLVEAHGGRIWAESTPGATTSFHLTLPAAGTIHAPSSIDDDRDRVRASASGA